MKRRIVAWWLLLALLCAMMGASASNGVSLPDALDSIDDGAFAGDLSITEVEIPGNCESIGAYAFANCANLKKVSVPAGVTFIGEHAFDGCGDLTLCVKDNPYACLYAIDHGIRLSSEDADIIASGSCGDSAVWQLTASGIMLIEGSGAIWPGSETVDGDLSVIVNPFDEKYRPYIKALLIDEGIEAVGAMAFLGCGALEWLSLPGSLSTVGESAFRDCFALESVTLRGQLGALSARMFEGCVSLEEIEIPDGVTAIGARAFCHSGLRLASLPASLTAIADDAFEHCPEDLTLEMPYCDEAYDYAVAHGIACAVRSKEHYCIYDASCENRVLSVSVTTEEACVLHYTIADENSGATLFTGTADVAADLWSTPLAIPLDASLPQGFGFSARLYTADGHKLNDTFETIRMTSRFMRFSSQTVDDYADHVTVRYGGGNFAALADGAVDASDDSECVASGRYIIDSDSKPAPGDVMLVKNAKGEDEPILVKTVTENDDGSFTVIEDKDATLSDLFDCYRLSVSCVSSDLATNGDEQEVYLGHIVFDEQFGPVNIRVDGGVKLHSEMVYDKKLFGEDYYEFTNTVELDSSATIRTEKAISTDEVEGLDDLLTIFDAPITGIKGLASMNAKLSVPFKLKVDGAVEVTGRLLSKVGVKVTPDKQEPISSNEFKPDIKGEVEFEGTLIGVKAEIYAALVKDLVRASISAECSIKVKAKLLEMKESDIVRALAGLREDVHACLVCIEGNLKKHFAINVSVTWEISKKCKGDLLNVDLLSADADLFNFYISIINDPRSMFGGLMHMGIGDCPNHRYRTNFYTLHADSNGVAGIPVRISTSEGELVDQGESPYKTFLYPGDYTAEAEFPSGPATKDFKVTTGKQDVYIVEKLCVVSGKVTDENDKAIAGASVVAEDDKGKATRTTTDQNGLYTLSLPRGKYSFGFSATDYEPQVVDRSVSTDITLNMTLPRVKYTINFKPNGGTCSTSRLEVEIHKPVGTLPTPRRDDYVFVEWNTEADGSGDTLLATTVPTGNMTVYAIWKQVGIRLTGKATSFVDYAPIKDVVVQFALRGGETTSTSTDSDGEFSVFLPFGTYDLTFTHPDYRTETMTAVKIVEGSSSTVGVLMIPRDYYIVTFRDDDGSYIGKIAVKSGGYARKPDDPTPRDEGLVFKGWFKEGQDTAFDFAHTKVYQDMTLYAQWDNGDVRDLAFLLDLDDDARKRSLGQMGFTITSFTSTEYEATRSDAPDKPRVFYDPPLVSVELWPTSTPAYSLLELTTDMTYAQMRQKLLADGWSSQGRETFRPDDSSDDINEYMFSKGSYNFSICVNSNTGALYMISMYRW